MGFTSPQLGTMSLIGQVGGAIQSGIGSYYAAKSQKSALNAAAGIADTNARIAELGAQSALQQGEKEVGRLTLRAGQIKSSQRAAMAANGVDLGVGNAAEVQASTDIMKEIDANQITANAVNNAWGIRTQAVSLKNEALTKRAAASGISPGMAAGTSLIGGASKVASSWYQMDKAGVFDNSPSNAAKQAASDFTDGWNGFNYG